MHLCCRPPSRGRGLKSQCGQERHAPEGRPPSRGRGLKSSGTTMGRACGGRPPSRGRGLKCRHHLAHRGHSGRPPSRGRGLKYRWHRSLGTRSAVAPPRGGRGLKSPSSSAAGGSSPVAPSRGAWIEIAAHTAPRRTRPSPLRPVCPPGAPSCRPEKSSFVPSVVMYPVSFQLFVSPKNSFADFTWPFFSASE